MPLFRIILLLCIPFFGFTQTELQELRDLFEKPNEDVAVAIYKGYLNEVHPVICFMGERNGELRGHYRMVSSGQKIHFTGDKKGKLINLIEQSSTGEEIAFIQLRGDQQVEGYWMTSDRDEILPIKLLKSRYGDFVFTDHKRAIQFYQTDKRKKNWSILLEEIDDRRIMAQISSPTKVYRDVSIKCPTSNCNEFRIQLGDEKLFCEKEKNQLIIQWKDESEVKLDLHKTAEIARIAYGNYHFLMDVNYAKTGNKPYDIWIEKMLKEKRNQKQETISQNQDVIDQKSEAHYFYQWTGWQEVDLLNDVLISGRLVLYDSWNMHSTTVPIVYAFEENVPIDVIGDFKKIKTAQELIRYMISHDWKYEFQGQEEELENISFTNACVAKGGIMVATNFSPVFGYQKVFIPYRECKRLIRRRSLIHEVLKT